MLQVREGRRGVRRADAFLPLGVRIRAQAQGLAVDETRETRTPERWRKHSSLFGRRVESIVVRAFRLHAHIVPSSV